MKIKATQVRAGDLLDLDGVLHKVVESIHVTPGKGKAHMQYRMKNLDTGNKIELRVNSDEVVEKAFLDSHKMVYQYRDDEQYVFMNLETYEQVFVHRDDIEEQIPFLVEDLEVTAYTYQGQVVNIELPLSVELKVVETAPRIRGATVTNQPKPATLETGLTINVPSFVETGEKVRVDTRTGQYIERAGGA